MQLSFVEFVDDLLLILNSLALLLEFHNCVYCVEGLT